MKSNFLFFLLCISALPAFSQWNSNNIINNVVANSNASEQYPVHISDGSGGSIIVFESSYPVDLYAQRITSSGTIAWGDSAHPVAICNATGSQGGHSVIADGNGGAFIAWEDNRDESTYGNIFIQHINSAGSSLWAFNGIRVTNTPGQYESFPTLCLDGSGGVFVCWDWDNTINNFQSYAQHFSSTGAATWAAGGVQVCTAPGFRTGGSMVNDGNNGVIIFLKDSRNDPNGTNYNYSVANYEYGMQNIDIYAQKINPAGVLQWTGNGAAVCTASGNQDANGYYFAVTDGNGGAIIVFDDDRNDIPLPNGNPTNEDIYAQRINNNGIKQWASNGIPVTNLEGNQDVLQIAADSANGVVVVFQHDLDEYYVIGSQRISVTGIPVWTVDGVGVSVMDENCFDGTVTRDGQGNYLYSFTQYPLKALKIQKLNPAGDMQFAPEGVIVNQGYFLSPELSSVISSNAGSVIVNWQQNRNVPTGYDLYASKVLSDGTLAGAPSNATTTASGNWNNPASWTGGVVPGANAAVTVKNPIIITTNTTCYSLTVLPPGTITVAPGVIFTILH